MEKNLDIGALSADEFNKWCIRNNEGIIKDSKELLKQMYMHKEFEYPEWYKALVRWNKNTAEKNLKYYVECQQNLRSGLNPPEFYLDCQHDFNWTEDDEKTWEIILGNE